MPSCIRFAVARPASLLSLAILLFAVRLPAEPSVEWEPHVEFGGQIFPSFIIATHGIDFADGEVDDYHIGDTSGIIGIGVTSTNSGDRVSLEVSCAGLMRPSTVEGTLEEADALYGLFPIIDWDFDKLHAAGQARPTVINFKLTVNGKPAGTKQAKAFLRPINDCPFAMMDAETGEGMDTSWMFAAYVNEDHPWIDEMLGDALDLGIVSSFDGYQSGDPGTAVMQAFAIWKALRNEGIRYSNITTSVGKKDLVASQEVRFLDESIDNAQANCVDGSVMIASFLRKIDIEPALVMVPGHCFLAFSLDSEGSTILGLETTMLGSPVDDPEAVLNALPDDIEFSEELASDEAWLNFLAAVLVGTQQLEEHAASFEDENNMEYQIIDIAAAREMGIMPIAHVER